MPDPSMPAAAERAVAALEQAAAGLERASARMNAVNLRGAARILRGRPGLDPRGELAAQLDRCADAFVHGDGVVDVEVVDDQVVEPFELMPGRYNTAEPWRCSTTYGGHRCLLEAGHPDAHAMSTDPVLDAAGLCDDPLAIPPVDDTQTPPAYADDVVPDAVRCLARPFTAGDGTRVRCRLERGHDPARHQPDRTQL